MNWICRFHPFDWWHEMGCPHIEWTKEQLEEAAKTNSDKEKVSEILSKLSTVP